MKGRHGYALRSPGGRLIPETFDTNKMRVESNAYDYLYPKKEWARRGYFWKNWDAFVAERERRRWFVVVVKLIEVA